MASINRKADKKQFNAAIVKKLGVRIKQLRKEGGYLNYEKFANDNDINRTQFGRYEKGVDLRFTSIVHLAKSFNMTLDEFFKGFDINKNTY